MHISVENRIKLWVENAGSKGDETCLLISGAGAGASFWSERFCNRLSAKGFFVIKYDHRDFGYSDKVDFNKYPYNMMDLCKDAIAVLNAFDINKAHIVGHSMGGFITQLLAIHYPERLITFTSISSSTNSPDIPTPPEETWQLFMENNPTGDFKKDLNGFLKVWKYLNGTAAFDEELAVEYTRNLYARQDIKGAIGESHVKAQESLSDRSEQLKSINIPALIMHGEEDYLVDKYGGIQTTESISGSKLVLIAKMGHIPFNQEIIKRFENEIIQFINENSLTKNENE